MCINEQIQRDVWSGIWQSLAADESRPLERMKSDLRLQYYRLFHRSHPVVFVELSEGASEAFLQLCSADWLLAPRTEAEEPQSPGLYPLRNVLAPDALLLYRYTPTRGSLLSQRHGRLCDQMGLERQPLQSALSFVRRGEASFGYQVLKQTDSGLEHAFGGVAMAGEWPLQEELPGIDEMHSRRGRFFEQVQRHSPALAQQWRQLTERFAGELRRHAFFQLKDRSQARSLVEQFQGRAWAWKFLEQRLCDVPVYWRAYLLRSIRLECLPRAIPHEERAVESALSADHESLEEREAGVSQHSGEIPLWGNVRRLYEHMHAEIDYFEGIEPKELSHFQRWARRRFLLTLAVEGECDISALDFERQHPELGFYDLFEERRAHLSMFDREMRLEASFVHEAMEVEAKSSDRLPQQLLEHDFWEMENLLFIARYEREHVVRCLRRRIREHANCGRFGRAEMSRRRLCVLVRRIFDPAVTHKELAERFGVGATTIGNDLEAIQDLQSEWGT